MTLLTPLIPSQLSQWVALDLIIRDFVDPSDTLTAITVGRSISAVTSSTLSKVRYRRTVNVDKRRSESASLYLGGGGGSISSIRLLALLQRERKTGNYNSPLVGCIAPSALKCFSQNQQGTFN